ncbi:MAG: hypothetical protein IPM06_19625 [Rhizobiales bacterium]|nr:hypothetical protein [Hyphomicrobiales bacterium]
MRGQEVKMSATVTVADVWEEGDRVGEVVTNTTTGEEIFVAEEEAAAPIRHDAWYQAARAGWITGWTGVIQSRE